MLSYNVGQDSIFKGVYMITDSQIFIALLFALVSAVLAIQLGAELYS